MPLTLIDNGNGFTGYTTTFMTCPEEETDCKIVKDPIVYLNERDTIVDQVVDSTWTSKAADKVTV